MLRRADTGPHKRGDSANADEVVVVVGGPDGRQTGAGAFVSTVTGVDTFIDD